MRGGTDDDDSPETPLLGDNDSVVTILNSDNESPNNRSARRSKSTTDRFRTRNPSALGARRTPSNLFKNSSDNDPQNEVSRRSLSSPTTSKRSHWWSNSNAPKPLNNSDVAFTIVVNRQADDDDTGQGEDDDDDPDNNNRVEVDFVQEAVQEAIQEAVQDAVQEVVQDTVTEAVQEAVAAAFEENVRFDVRANFYTLIAITGVILYWRGVWNSWDYCFGLSIWSETASVVTGLVVMLTMRYLQVPLVESLPGG
ncbi:hypothetical protein ABBQ38_008898 [Trebouxia sp. C0009 RCD-2024]